MDIFDSRVVVATEIGLQIYGPAKLQVWPRQKVFKVEVEDGGSIRIRTPDDY